MESSRFQSLVLIAAVLGAAVLGIGSHSIGPAVGDIAILLALFAFDDAPRSGGQSIAFAGVCGVCLLAPLFFLANNILGATVPAESTPWMYAGAWAVVTLIIFAVDRFRMSARDNVSLAGSGLAGAAQAPIIMSQPPSSYRPAPIRVEPVPQAAYHPPPPAPVYTPPQPVYTPPQPVYTPPQPAYTPPQPVYTPPVAPPLEAANFEATNFAAPIVTPEYAPPPPPDVTAIPPGREALIYLNLVGEGLNVLRTVRAENLGRDYYRIADIMPQGEQWEFTPGQVVKCRKKSLSNGKHMVAYEEAPRAQ